MGIVEVDRNQIPLLNSFDSSIVIQDSHLDWAESADS